MNGTVDRRRALEAYIEAERMRREANWHRKARRCVHPVWICYAIVVGAWAVAEAMHVIFG